jgi:hypothetical protein
VAGYLDRADGDDAVPLIRFVAASQADWTAAGIN